MIKFDSSTLPNERKIHFLFSTQIFFELVAFKESLVMQGWMYCPQFTMRQKERFTIVIMLLSTQVKIKPTKGMAPLIQLQFKYRPH